MKNRKNVILVLMFGVLAITSVIMTVETATSSMEVSKLRDDESKLADQKRYLEQKVVKTLSIGQLQEKSGELGFVKPTDLFYVSGTESVAKLP